VSLHPRHSLCQHQVQTVGGTYESHKVFRGSKVS
jgi:hypothetical protein